MAGSGFTDLTFDISAQGNSIYSKDFTTVADAQAFFDDQVLNLGPISALDPGSTGVLDLDISMQITSSNQGSGFFAGMLVGDPPPAQSSAPLVGTSGPDTFTLASGFGDATIANFDPSQDVVQFDHGMFSDFIDLVSHAASSGGNTVITADAHDALTLQSVTPGQLHASDFHFG